MSTEDETHLLSGAYALDALTPEEAAAVEAAMRGSEELRNEVVGLADTAVTLGLAVPPLTPPPALRASVLSAIQDLPQLPAEEEGTHEDAVPAPASADPLRSTAHVVPRRRRRLLRRPAVLLTAAAVAVLLFGGGALMRGAMVEPQLEYSRIVAAADVQESDGRVDGGGSATVYWSDSQDGTAVVLKGVRAPAGQVLQLWSLRDGLATSEGLYEPHADADYALIDGTPAAGERLAVTVEPAGGSEEPTSDPVVVVPLTA